MMAKEITTYFVNDGYLEPLTVKAVTVNGEQQADGWYWLMEGMDDGEGPYDTEREAIVAGEKARLEDIPEDDHNEAAGAAFRHSTTKRVFLTDQEHMMIEKMCNRQLDSLLIHSGEEYTALLSILSKLG